METDLRNKMNALELKALENVKDKVNVVELTDAQVEEWKKAAAPVVDVYIKNAGAIGKQLVDAARGL